MEYVIETQDLTKVFGNFTAVDKLNIKIKQGEIFGFLGPNGAGKSTAIKMLTGILEPTAGGGKILGYDLRTDSERIKENIGYMSQKFSLYSDLTVLENLKFYAGIYNIPYKLRKKRIEELLSLAQLEGKEGLLVSHLSSGWKQRLALGCAIMARPSLLFLDEPTSGVSPTIRRLFFNIIQELSQAGTTILVTTHFMDEAERCHKIAFLKGGKLLADDTPARLKSQVLDGILAEVESPGINNIKKIEDLAYVKECTIHGALLHIVLANKGYISSLENDTGLKPVEITPSLEDVFLALSKGREEER